MPNSSSSRSPMVLEQYLPQTYWCVIAAQFARYIELLGGEEVLLNMDTELPVETKMYLEELMYVLYPEERGDLMHSETVTEQGGRLEKQFRDEVAVASNECELRGPMTGLMILCQRRLHAGQRAAI